MAVENPITRVREKNWLQNLDMQCEQWMDMLNFNEKIDSGDIIETNLYLLSICN